MSKYARISADDAYRMLIDGSVNIVDVRDPESFKAGHITDAVHLDNAALPDYIHNTEKDTPLIVCCYHGNMSQSAGEYLAQQGFHEVYSLDGGFANWSARFPDECDP